MKKIILTICALSFSLFANAEDPFKPEEKLVLPSVLYVPGKFDSNDNVKIHIDGIFSNGCYKITKADVKVDFDTATITVFNKANFFDVPCIQAVSLYDKTLEFGILIAGDYSINFINEKEQSIPLGSIKIAQATTAKPDDYPYAPIQSVDVVKEDGKFFVKLKGKYTNTCQAIDYIEAKSSASNVLDILPIMVEQVEPCAAKVEAFTVVAEIKPQNMGKHLINVRSYEGNDKFMLYDFK